MRSALRVFAGLLAFTTVLPAQQYVFRAYRQADGLKNLGVRSLATDCDGFLWVATENGVFRFLGSSFQHYGPDQGIAELGIQEIAADASCTVWAGTTHNLYAFDGKRFAPAAQTPVPLDNTHGLAVEDDRDLLAVDGTRLVRIEHGRQGHDVRVEPVLGSETLAAFPELGHITSVSVVADGAGTRHIWVGAGGTIYAWPDKTRQAQGRQPATNEIAAWGKMQGVPEDHWESVVVDGSGTVWAEGWSHIVALPAAAERFVDRSLGRSTLGSYFSRSRLVVDPQGRVLAPADGGMVRWNGKGWQAIDRSSGLPRKSQMGAMLFDAAGDLWLGSYGDGLYHWPGYGQWEGWSDDRALPALIVWALDASQPGRVLAGTDNGPAWIDAETGQSGALRQAQPWTAGMIVAMGRERDGSLWAAANSGRVLRMDAATGRVLETVKAPGSILSAVAAADGSLYLDTDKGIYARPAGAANHQPQPVPAAAAAARDFTRAYGACRATDGAVWFVSHNRFLRELGGAWSSPAIEGLPGADQGRLVALSCAPDGTLWATGERIGTWHIRGAGGRYEAARLELPADFHGIESYVVLADRRGWLWLGTDQGLLVWNGKSWRHLTQESGMIWNDVDEWGLGEGADDSIWVGTSGGVAHLTHPEDIFAPVPLKVAITGVERGDGKYAPEGMLRLDWSTLPLRLQLASPLERNRSELVFKYQLEGQRSGWIESRDGTAVLSALAPGRYIFTALASNAGTGSLWISTGGGTKNTQRSFFP